MADPESFENLETNVNRLATRMRAAVLGADDAADVHVQATILACFWLARHVMQLAYAPTEQEAARQEWLKVFATLLEEEHGGTLYIPVSEN